MKILLLFLLFMLLPYTSFSFVMKANIKALKLTSINYNHVHRKNIRSLKIYLYPRFLKRIVEPLENVNFKNYFFFRSLSRICVSLSSAFSLNAKVYLYRKNMNNLLLTQLLMNNEIFIKILKICWLYKLSHFIDKNIKLCRYLSTIFYIISIYLDILSTYDISKNFYFYYFLYSLSSILKNLSILTYTSIRSSINFHVSQMLSYSNQKINKESMGTIKLTDKNGGENISGENINNENINNENINNENINNENINNENINVNEKLMEINALKKDKYKVINKFYAKKKEENNNNNILRNNLNVKRKTFYIGEISVITDLLFSLVDLSTILFLSRATKYIKQKLFFYIFLSSLHLFFSYKELEYLLI
ncbi:conserved Plasmodium membrane protein, unknown function [Plasmodium relictum]|uniref:Apicoplast integral membrane protein n=1 Tax=Plasmodium relictum TaxID=85471 RepID=A0A1J1H8N4_PLARL|nr:conserved Plasmodium membrane protein, unknown function [Plasmodium relictum]CRH00911.1 conserved Plasmodium membrane protein, unknown function [Plasmodium relictum]